MADPRNRQGVRGIAATATDPRRGKQRALAARGAAGALVLGILAVVLQSAATATPAWGYFTTPDREFFFFFLVFRLIVCLFCRRLLILPVRHDLGF